MERKLMTLLKIASVSLLLVTIVALTSSVNAYAQIIFAGNGFLLERHGNCTTTYGHGAIKTDCNPQPTTVFLNFKECSGTNENHNVHCTVSDAGITDINKLFCR